VKISFDQKKMLNEDLLTVTVYTNKRFFQSLDFRIKRENEEDDDIAVA